jgi:hypothetical protein
MLQAALHWRPAAIMCGCEERKIAKYTWQDNGVYGGNIKITAITEIYEVLVRVYFVSQGQITAVVIIGQVVTERYLCLVVT